MRLNWIATLFALALFATACASPAASPPQPTTTPDQSVYEEDENGAWRIASPTATAQPRPSATPTPSPTATATPDPTPVPSPDYNAGVWRNDLPRVIIAEAVKDRDRCLDEAATGQDGWPAGRSAMIAREGVAECDGWLYVRSRDPAGYTWVRAEYTAEETLANTELAAVWVYVWNDRTRLEAAIEQFVVDRIDTFDAKLTLRAGGWPVGSLCNTEPIWRDETSAPFGCSRERVTHSSITDAALSLGDIHFRCERNDASGGRETYLACEPR